MREKESSSAYDCPREILRTPGREKSSRRGWGKKKRMVYIRGVHIYTHPHRVLLARNVSLTFQSRSRLGRKLERLRASIDRHRRSFLPAALSHPLSSRIYFILFPCTCSAHSVCTCIAVCVCVCVCVCV